MQGDGRPVERVEVNSFPQARRCGRLFDPTIKAVLRVLRVLRQGQGFRVRLVTAPTASYSGSSLAPRCRRKSGFASPLSPLLRHPPRQVPQCLSRPGA